MLIRPLSNSDIQAYGKILQHLPDTIHNYTLQIKKFRSGSAETFVADGPIILDYHDGMPKLMLYSTQTDIFYLDRIIMLMPDVKFSIIPMEQECSVRLYVQKETVLSSVRSGSSRNAVGELHPNFEDGHILTFFYQECARDFFFRGERHEPYELVYVDKGELHNIIEGNKFVLHQQELLIIDRNKWHIQFSNNAISFISISFHLPGELLKPIINRQLQLPDNIRQVLLKMLHEQENCGKYSGDYIEGLFKILLVELLVQYSGNSKNISQPSPMPVTRYMENDILNYTLQIINEHIEEKITLSDLSSAVHISPSNLNRLFQHYLGMSPAKYITKLRLQACKDLLRDGDMSVSAVAKKMGYSSIQHFSHQFKQYYGISPSEYSRSLR